ncbi:MAG TPA: hypothetical protein VGX76_14425 [Pirellulales bacterium]|nr:hypothetical protein [Pirellulales bacterium]
MAERCGTSGSPSPAAGGLGRRWAFPRPSFPRPSSHVELAYVAKFQEKR